MVILLYPLPTHGSLVDPRGLGADLPAAQSLTARSAKSCWVFGGLECENEQSPFGMYGK